MTGLGHGTGTRFLPGHPSQVVESGALAALGRLVAMASPEGVGLPRLIAATGRFWRMWRAA